MLQVILTNSKDFLIIRLMRLKCFLKYQNRFYDNKLLLCRIIIIRHCSVISEEKRVEKEWAGLDSLQVMWAPSTSLYI
jgi:hypothetical protein